MRNSSVMVKIYIHIYTYIYRYRYRYRYIHAYIYIYIYIYDFLVITAFGNLWHSYSANMGASLLYFIFITLLKLKIELTSDKNYLPTRQLQTHPPYYSFQMLLLTEASFILSANVLHRKR